MTVKYSRELSAYFIPFPFGSSAVKKGKKHFGVLSSVGMEMSVMHAAWVDEHRKGIFDSIIVIYALWFS